jgi:hypothetical protein
MYLPLLIFFANEIFLVIIKNPLFSKSGFDKKVEDIAKDEHSNVLLYTLNDIVNYKG